MRVTLAGSSINSPNSRARRSPESSGCKIRRAAPASCITSALRRCSIWPGSGTINAALPAAISSKLVVAPARETMRSAAPKAAIMSSMYSRTSAASAHPAASYPPRTFSKSSLPVWCVMRSTSRRVARCGSAATIASLTARAPCEPPKMSREKRSGSRRFAGTSKNSRRTGLPVTTPFPPK